LKLLGQYGVNKLSEWLSFTIINRTEVNVFSLHLRNIY